MLDEYYAWYLKIVKKQNISREWSTTTRNKREWMIRLIMLAPNKFELMARYYHSKDQFGLTPMLVDIKIHILRMVKHWKNNSLYRNHHNQFKVVEKNVKLPKLFKWFVAIQQEQHRYSCNFFANYQWIRHVKDQESEFDAYMKQKMQAHNCKNVNKAEDGDI